MFRSIVSRELGESVFYIWEISKVLSNLGGPTSRECPRKRLKDRKVDYEKLDLGIDLKRLKRLGNLGSLYRQSAVWGMLEELNKSGTIDLAQYGIASFDDILARGLHQTEVGYGGSIGRRRGRELMPKT